MPGINKVILIGNLGCDPMLGSTQAGERIVRFDLVTSETWRDRSSGEQRERTERHHIVVFNDQIAEVAERYLRKGSQVYVEGLLRMRSWRDDDGRQHRITEIVLSQHRGKLVMLDRSSGPETPNEFTMIFGEMFLRLEAARAAAGPDGDHQFRDR